MTHYKDNEDQSLNLLYNNEVDINSYQNVSKEGEVINFDLNSKNWRRYSAEYDSKLYLRTMYNIFILRLIVFYILLLFYHKSIYKKVLVRYINELKLSVINKFTLIIESIVPETADMYCVIGIQESSTDNITVFGPFFSKEVAEKFRSSKSNNSSLVWTIRKVIHLDNSSTLKRV